MVLVLLVSSAVVLVLTATVVGQRRRIDELTAVTHDRPATRSTELITIEIRNHVDLAADRTGLARPLSRVAPGLIRSLVHKETLKLLRIELAEQGVDADVRLRRVRPAAASIPVAPDDSAPALDP